MRKDLTFTIEGKDYPAIWESLQDPTPKDLEEIEAGIRQKYNLNPVRQEPQPKSSKQPLTTPYKWGGDDPKDGGMDCSGLTCYLKKKEGIKIPRTAIGQFKGGQLVPTAGLQAGDLVFFDTGANHRADNRIKDGVGNTYHVSHVGVYLGDGKMMHQSSSKGKTVTVDFERYRQGAKFLGARRYEKPTAKVATQPKPATQNKIQPVGGVPTNPFQSNTRLTNFEAIPQAGRQLQAQASKDVDQAVRSQSSAEMDIKSAMALVDDAIGKRISPKQKEIIQSWLTDVGGVRNITRPMVQTALHYAGKGQYTDLVDRGQLYRDMPFRLEDLIAARRSGAKAISGKSAKSSPYQVEYANEMVAKYLGIPRSKLTDKLINPALEDYVRAQELPFAPADLIVAQNQGKKMFNGREENSSWDVKSARAEVAKKLGIPVAKLTDRMIIRLAKADSLPPAKLDDDQKLDPLTQALADSIPDPNTDPLGFGLKLLQRGGQFAPDLLRDALGQGLGMKRGDMYESPHVRDSQIVRLGDTVFQIGKYFIPGAGPAMIAGDIAGVAGRAREVGGGKALKEFGGEMLHSMNFLEPGLGWGEFTGRLINAGLMGVGVKHGISKTGKTVSRLGIVHDLAKTGKLSLAEAWQVLKVSEGRAGEYVASLRAKSQHPEEGPVEVLARQPAAEEQFRPREPLTEDLKSAQHAQAVLRAATGDFEPATPQQMKAAFDANRAQVTLSDHSPEDLANMFTFKMRDGEIYYALNPMEAHWETGKPAVDITSVMNNQGGAPGVATPGVMLHAIETWLDLGGQRIGDLTLDAWDVAGFLPKRYARYGFKEYGRSHYDVEAYGEPSPELKSAWKQDNWTEGDPFPSVVYMRYEGPTEPGAARRNYIETGTIDRSGVSGPEPGAPVRILPDNEGGDRTGRAGEFPPGEQGGETAGVRDAPGAARSARGPLDSFSRAVRSLHDFSDAELFELGIDPAQVRAMNPLPEQASLPFSPEERALLGMEAVPDGPGDIGNPQLFPESDAAIRGKIGEYGAKNVLVNREAYEQAVQEIKDGLNRMQSGVDPSLLASALKVAVYHAEAGLRSFGDFVQELTAVVGQEAVDKLREHLPGIWDQARLKALNYKVPGQGPEFSEPGYNQQFLNLANQYKAKVQEASKLSESEGFAHEANQALDRAQQLEGELLEELLRQVKSKNGLGNVAGATRQWMQTIIEAQMQTAASSEQLVSVLREKFDLDAGQVKDVKSILRANELIVSDIQNLVGGTAEQIRAPLDYMTMLQTANSPLDQAFGKLGPEQRRLVRELQEAYAKNNESLLNRLLKGADRVFLDQTIAMYKGFMLLGLKGPVNNFLSNLFNSLVLSASRPLRGGFDRVLGTITGRRTRTAGFQGPLTGIRQAANREVWGRVTDSLRGASADYAKYDVARLTGLADGPAKTVTEMGFRLASAGDKPFYALAFDRAIGELAKLQAMNEGLQGSALRDRVAEILNQPPDGMVLEAGLQADYAVLSNKNVLADAVAKGKAELKKGGPFAKGAGVASEFILPFVKVPLNAAGRALEFAGFGVLEGVWDLGKYTVNRFSTERGLQQVRRTTEFLPDPGASPLENARAKQEWQLEGRGKTVDTVPFTQIFNPKFIKEMFSMMPPSAQRKIADNLGNGVTGLGLLWLGYVGYQRGLIRPLGGGDPEDWNEATATGNVPGGLRVGEYDIDLKSSVVGRILAAGATYGAWRAGRVQDAEGNPDGVQAFNDVLKSVSDNPLVQGTSVLSRMSERPVQGLADFTVQQAGTFGQPAFVRELSRLASPNNPVVERNNPADRWWSNVARGAQQAKTDVFGFVDSQSYAQNILGTKRNKSNPVASELQELGIEFTKPGMSKANKAKWGDPNVENGKDLRADYTAKDYADRVAFVGMRVFQELSQLIADPSYKSMSRTERKEELKSVIKAVREGAGEELDGLRIDLGTAAARNEVWKLLREHNSRTK